MEATDTQSSITIFQVLAIVSPIVAVIISIWLNEYLMNRRIIKERKDDVLKMLIENRYDTSSNDFLKAMNSIPIVFKDHNNIRAKQENLYSLIEEETRNRISTDKRNQFVQDLIKEICHELGYSKKITSDDIRRVFKF